MNIFENTTLGTVLTVLLIALTVFLLFVTINLTLSVHRLHKKYKQFMRGADGLSLEKMFNSKFKAIDRLESQINLDHQVLDMIRNTQAKTLTKYGIVKYDAFDDVGGKKSFALANLDKSNTGYILNAIHSRDNCFLYLKEIVKGESYIMLSDEEIQALKIAVNGSLDMPEKEK